LATGRIAHGQSDDRQAKLAFDIAAQPLEQALDAFGSTSHFQVLYETAMTLGRKSAELRGTYTQEAALRQLLSGTGLDFAYTEEHAFTLIPVKLSAAPPSYRISDFDRFLGSVQATVMAALCRQSETRPGPFTSTMQFFIDSSGRVANPRLLTSSGLSVRDVAITDVLKHVAVGEAPPPTMPQPITMVLRSGPPIADDQCR
jgi:hypothetical protein